MESFLKNRAVHNAAGAGGSPMKPVSADAGSNSPFAPIQSSSMEPANRGTRGEGPHSGGSEPAVDEDAGHSVDGASVRAVMERGRITKLIVTCSCGKVTEVACSYGAPSGAHEGRRSS